MSGRVSLLVVLLMSVPACAAELKPRTLDGFAGNIHAVSFAPDGKRVAATSATGEVCVWDVTTGKILWRQMAASSSWGIAFSPDSKTVAVPGNGGDASVTLYDAANGKPVGTLTGQTGSIWTCCFSHDGKRIAASATDGTVRIWDVATRKELQQFTGPSGPWSIAFSPDGRRFAVGFDNGTITTYDARTWKEERSWMGGGSGIWSMAFSADGRLLGATAWQNPSVQVYETLTGTLRDTFEGGAATGWCVGFTADGAGVKVGASALTVWDPLSGRKAEAKTTPLLYAVSTTADGRFVAAGDMQGAVHIWDIRELRKGLRPAEAKVPARDLDDHWAALTDADAERAGRAIRALAATPTQSVPLLRERVKPIVVSEVDFASVEKLVKQLDDDDFDVREKASMALEKLGPTAAPALRAALDKTKSAEVRRRLQTLLDRWSKTALSGDEMRVLRAVEILEGISTPEAKRVLEGLAKGADALLTHEAAAALTRLNRVKD